MKVSFKGNTALKVQFYYEDSTNINSALKENAVFKGKNLEIYFNLAENILMVGLGKKEDADGFRYVKCGITLCKKLKALEFESTSLLMTDLDETAVFFISEGLLTEGLYDFSLKKEKEKTKLKEVVFEVKNQDTVKEAKVIAKSRNFVRELVDTPSNILTPDEMAKRVSKKLEADDTKVEIWDEKKLEKENLQGLIHVGKASVYPPRLVKITYTPKNPSKKVTLVGKGITFDAGGLSLKPSDSMLDMKGDMAGAATVAACISACQKLNLNIQITGFLVLAENVISGNAYKVSDVITYNNGKSVEIANTDAEGRLALADALILSDKVKDDLIIDLATLTGACMVALGSDYYGAFSPDEKLSREYSDFVNSKTSEKAWAMPVYDKYKEQMKSKIADIKNIGKRWGGAITAALFLKEFVPENKNWLHLDIAGPFFDEGLGLLDGVATGIPLESLTLYLKSLISQK